MSKLLLLLVCTLSILYGQNGEYDPSDSHPFGRINPEAPVQIRDFEEMIGICECRSVRRNTDGSWQDTLSMVWKFKYILNGMAVQDETWKEDGSYATSIRQYNTDSLNWVVSFYSSSFVSNAVNVWTGNRKGDTIILTRSQKSPNGLDGTSRLTFYDISETGFKWKGEWLDLKGKIVYPFWTISCNKKN